MKLLNDMVKKDQKSVKITKDNKDISYSEVERLSAGNSTSTWGIIFYR